MTLIAV